MNWIRGIQKAIYLFIRDKWSKVRVGPNGPNELWGSILFTHLEQYKIEKTALHNEQSSLLLRVISKGAFTSFLVCLARFSFYFFTAIQNEEGKGF